MGGEIIYLFIYLECLLCIRCKDKDSFSFVFRNSVFFVENMEFLVLGRREFFFKIETDRGYYKGFFLVFFDFGNVFFFFRILYRGSFFWNSDNGLDFSE